MDDPQPRHGIAISSVLLIGLGLIVLPPMIGSGEVIVVSKSGQTVAGESVKSESDTELALEIYRGFTKTIPKSAIAKRTEVARSQPDERAEFASRLAKLAKDDVKGRLELVRWARGQNLGIPAARVLYDLDKQHPGDTDVRPLLPEQAVKASLTTEEHKFLDGQVREYFAAPTTNRDKVVESLRGKDVLPLDSVDAWAKRCFEEARKGPKARAGDFTFTHKDPDFEGKVHIELWRKGGPSTRGDLPEQDKPWPVLISLHGGGLNAGTWKDGGPMMFNSFRKHFDKMILVAPNVLQQRYAEWGGNPVEEFYVRELFKAVKRTWNIDMNRVYLAGYSMGGYGTWHIGSHEADLFAGLVSGAGGLLIGSAQGHTWGWGSMANLMHTPIAFLHGGKDKDSPPWSDEEANRILSALAREYPGRYRTQYMPYPDSGHMVPGDGIDKAVAWACGFSREANPKEILWEPKRPFNQQFYWLRLAKPDIFMRVHATIANNTVRVQTENVGGGLTILLNRHLVDLAKLVNIQIDGQLVFEGIVQPTLSTILQSVDSRLDEQMWFPARIDF